MRPLALTILLAIAAGCNREAAPAADTSAPAAARTEVVLSAEAQKEGEIETKPVKTSDEPDTLRVPGRIALADNRSWRVGVRTDGLVVAVSAEAGDYVRKGQVLARYHADEVRDSRAKYHAAQADVARAQSASALAQRNLERAGTLFELKAASQQQV
ncbi:MAG: biotin/lipoyl-binding protein, partial [Betaproteobacteria bacterium]